MNKDSMTAEVKAETPNVTESTGELSAYQASQL